MTKPKTGTIILGYEPEMDNGLFQSEKYKNIKIQPILDKITKPKKPALIEGKE